MSIAIFGVPRQLRLGPRLPLSLLVGSSLHHCVQDMLLQIPCINEPESPAGSIHYDFMSVKEAAAVELKGGVLWRSGQVLGPRTPGV